MNIRQVIATCIAFVALWVWSGCHAAESTMPPQHATHSTTATTSGTSGVVVNMNDIRHIPVGGSPRRDFSDAVLIAPTAQRVPGGMSVAGTHAGETRYSLDGATLNSPTSGTMRVEIVQEFLQSPQP